VGTSLAGHRFDYPNSDLGRCTCTWATLGVDREKCTHSSAVVVRPSGMHQLVSVNSARFKELNKRTKRDRIDVTLPALARISCESLMHSATGLRSDIIPAEVTAVGPVARARGGPSHPAGGRP